MIPPTIDISAKIPSRQLHDWHRFDGFIVNFEHISYLGSSVCIVNIEQVKAGWVHFGIFGKFSEKLTFLTIRYVHVRVCIRGYEMLVFRKILPMNDLTNI